MKKYFKYLCAVALVGMMSATLASCSEDKLGDTIFPEVSEELDPTSYTYKFDQWLKTNYLDIFNLEFQYKMEDVGTNMNYNLEPARLDYSIDLAVLSKYLWFDSYKEVTGSDEFVRAYGPRIIMLIGSSAINPTTHTEILGLAEGGIKVSLFKVNSMGAFLGDFNLLNEYFFKTMHHEFAHILHQRKSIPHEFRILSTGHYDAMDWQNRPEGVVNSLGFVTPYGSSEIREDFAEIIANYITKTDAQWEKIRRDAQRGWEKVVETNSSGQEVDVYYCFYYYDGNDASNTDNLKYANENIVIEDASVSSGYRLNRKDSDGNWIVVYPIADYDEVDGLAILETKISIARTWFKEQWGIDLDELRAVVQRRQLDFDLPALRRQVTD